MPRRGAASAAGPVTIFAGGVRLAVKAKPGQRQARPARLVTGADGTRAVEIAVAAVAEGGKANDALLDRLAAELGLARRDLAIAAGAAGRQKLVEIRGAPAALQAKLAAWLERIAAAP